MTPPRLRLALIIPGAVSLGAYEAGALTALLRLIRSSEGDIVVDTIVGASAGSVTGALLANALLTGKGDEDLEELWVRQTTISRLLAGHSAPGRPSAPLSSDLLERWARSRLTGAGIQPGVEEIALVVSIANLRGLRYRLAQSQMERAVVADTYRDAQAFLLGPDTDWEAVIQAAIASAANAFAFSPVRITRRKADYPPNVEFAGDTADLWYTDGGTVYNVPLGFGFDAVFDPGSMGLGDRRFREPRLFLLLNPHPTAPPRRWPREGDPTFMQTATRALSLATQQSIFDDLRRAEKTNSRIDARIQLQRRLGRLLPGDEGLASALTEMGEWLWERKRQIRGLVGTEVGPASLEEDLVRRGLSASPSSVLDFVLDEVTDTRGKETAQIEIVSPDRDAGETPVTDLLAGERLLHFFGFFLQRARESDFGLGYRNLRTWWEAFEPEPRLEIPPHRFEDVKDGGSLTMRDVQPAWERWATLGRLGVRYTTEAFRKR